MKFKLTLLIGAAIGYVLGSAAGRQRYEQIKALSKRFAQNPTVQAAASEATHKAADAASKVTHAAASKVGLNGKESESEFAGAGPTGYPPST